MRSISSILNFLFQVFLLVIILLFIVYLIGLFIGILEGKLKDYKKIFRELSIAISDDNQFFSTFPYELTEYVICFYSDKIVVYKCGKADLIYNITQYEGTETLVRSLDNCAEGYRVSIKKNYRVLIQLSNNKAYIGLTNATPTDLVFLLSTQKAYEIKLREYKREVEIIPGDNQLLNCLQNYLIVYDTLPKYVPTMFQQEKIINLFDMQGGLEKNVLISYEGKIYYNPEERLIRIII